MPDDRDHLDAKGETTAKPREALPDDKPGWGPLPAEKKTWKTPKVIVSSMHKAGAKTPPLGENNPFFSPDTNTVNS